MGVVHGFFVASGFVLLLVGLSKEAAPASGWWCGDGFAVVALGGAHLLSRQLRGRPWPSVVILLHGGAALVALAALAVWVFG